MGHFERTEHRAVLIFGIFGALLIPTIWVNGCLVEEFPKIPEMVISYLLFLVEGLVVAELIRRSYRRSSDEGRELNEHVEP
jgi:hypothetical protein